MVTVKVVETELFAVGIAVIVMVLTVIVIIVFVLSGVILGPVLLKSIIPIQCLFPSQIM